MFRKNFNYIFLFLIVVSAACGGDENVVQLGVDTQSPVISCPESININLDEFTNETIVTFTAPVGTDNLEGAVTTQTSGLPSGALFPVGITSNVFSVTDTAGNTATCRFDVTVTKDPATPPVKEGPFFAKTDDPTPSGKTWTKSEDLSDEFDGSTFDDTKWHRSAATDGFGWIGRAPGLFEADNVTVSDGNLNVTTEKFASPKVVRGITFTHGGAIVRSKKSGGQGMYYECRMKANKTVMSSTFWLSFKDNCPRKLELDIQENVGRVHNGTAAWAKNFDQIYHSNTFLHGRTCNGVTNETIQVQKGQTLTEKNHSRFFVYGCWWKSPTEILFYLDGEFIYSLTPPTDYDIEGFITMAMETYDWNPIDPVGSIFENGSFDDLTTKYDWVRTWKLEDI